VCDGPTLRQKAVGMPGSVTTPVVSFMTAVLAAFIFV